MGEFLRLRKYRINPFNIHGLFLLHKLDHLFIFSIHGEFLRLHKYRINLFF